MAPSTLALGLWPLLLTACVSSTEYAPRTPTQPAKPTSPSAIEMFMGRDKPRCSYVVIGSIFAFESNGLEALRATAARQGADGVYDIDCVGSAVGNIYGSVSRDSCVGRAFVCQSTGGAP